MLKGKHIILGVTGSIAAYKAATLTRLLVKEGASVKVVMTPLAKEFITPLTMATLSKSPIMVDFYNPENGDWNSHVDLGLWADLYLIAPASANTIGKMAGGIADNLLLTTYLSAKCPVMVAPAMDLDMYKHPATQRNLKVLQSFGNIIIEPESGELASGLIGKGRMEEPERIVAFIADYFARQEDFKGKKVVVTAGPTYEKIDPVRFIYVLTDKTKLLLPAIFLIVPNSVQLKLGLYSISHSLIYSSVLLRLGHLLIPTYKSIDFFRIQRNSLFIIANQWNKFIAVIKVINKNDID